MWRRSAALAAILAIAACGSVAQHLAGSSPSTGVTPSAVGSPSASPTPNAASSVRINPPQPSVPPSSPPPTPANAGTISGHAGYPAGHLPAMTVYAIATDNSRYFTAETSDSQTEYRMVGVAPGDYHVFMAGPIGMGSGLAPGEVVSSDARTGPVLRFRSAYTKFVPCGYNVKCTDHSLITVHVASGHTTTGIDPNDWYSGGSFALIPNPAPVLNRPGVVDRYSIELVAFTDTRSATAYLGSALTTSRYVNSAADCPANIACLWMTGERHGTSAAYVELAAGSNGVTQNCVIYLISTTAGWEQLPGAYASVCNPDGPPFPTVGRTGAITLPLDQSGCVRIHSEPDLSAKVVACLAVGTKITLDGGPAYVHAKPPLPPIDYPSTLDYWWHVAGRGWVVHSYVITYHYG